MFPNVLKLCANGVNVEATVYDLFKNSMDGLGLAWTGRVLISYKNVRNFLINLQQCYLVTLRIIRSVIDALLETSKNLYSYAEVYEVYNFTFFEWC